MTAFRSAVLEHFRRPRNRGSLTNPSASVEGSNPLCGDRLRMEVRIDGSRIAEAAFTADACAICIASASVVTDAARGLSIDDSAAIDVDFIERQLEGAPPPGRRKCVTLAIDTFHRAVRESQEKR